MAEPTPEDIRASYGFVGKLADSVPEINAILQQAIAGKWTADRFVMTVANTNWWKANGSGAREIMIQQATDPGNFEKERAAGARAIAVQLEQLGIPFDLDFDTLGAIWVRSKVEQVPADGMASWLFDAAPWMSNNALLNAGGRVGTVVNDMFRMAREYGYNPGDLTGEVLNEVRDMMQGGLAGGSEEWKSRMINYASSYYAPYAEEIRGGKTVAEIARPVIERVSNLLELNPDSMDFSDPILKKALTEWGDKDRAYSLNEIENFTRKDARWKTTDNAMESSVKLLNEIGQTFGLLGNR